MRLVANSLVSSSTSFPRSSPDDKMSKLEVDSFQWLSAVCPHFRLGSSPEIQYAGLLAVHAGHSNHSVYITTATSHETLLSDPRKKKHQSTKPSRRAPPPITTINTIVYDIAYRIALRLCLWTIASSSVLCSRILTFN
ncbi:Uncharacterized protein HZ326_11612 [Fusarium oxysporum f. sp. albedinis]|nr:Uncharacterized protein HZ326_11612 [Fusarium oxysporum f. sp. albedinis]